MVAYDVNVGEHELVHLSRGYLRVGRISSEISLVQRKRICCKESRMQGDYNLDEVGLQSCQSHGYAVKIHQSGDGAWLRTSGALTLDVEY